VKGGRSGKMAVRKIVSLYERILSVLEKVVLNGLLKDLESAYEDRIDDLERDIKVVSSFLDNLYSMLERFSSSNYGSPLLRVVISVLVAVIDVLVELIEEMEEFLREASEDE
jgi:hypothetical protein